MLFLDLYWILMHGVDVKETGNPVLVPKLGEAPSTPVGSPKLSVVYDQPA